MSSKKKTTEKPSKPLTEQIDELGKADPSEAEVLKSLEKEDEAEAVEEKTEDEILEDGLKEKPKPKGKGKADLSAYTTEELETEVSKRKTEASFAAVESEKVPAELVRGFLTNMPQDPEAYAYWEERFIKATVKIGVDGLKSIRENLNAGDQAHQPMPSHLIFKLDYLVKQVAKKQALLLSKA